MEIDSIRWFNSFRSFQVDVDSKYVLPENIGIANTSQSERCTLVYRVLEHHSAHGFLFFRQDQPRIDLFVFFSVFFSFFFLFLAASVIAWNIKSAVDARRARTRYVQEMQTMARRPFGKVSVVLNHLDLQSKKVQKGKLSSVVSLLVVTPEFGLLPVSRSVMAGLLLVLCWSIYQVAKKHRPGCSLALVLC